MKEPLYRQALTHSWKLAWHNKMLWTFGLFAALLGQMGIFDFLARISLTGHDTSIWPLAFKNAAAFQESLSYTTRGLSADGWVWFVWLLVIALGFLVLAAIMSVGSQGVIIDVVRQSMRSKKLNIAKAWHKSIGHFWSLFFINVFKKIIIVALTVVVGWASYNAVVEAGVGDIWIFFLTFILATAIGGVASFIAIYAAGYVVVENRPIGEAIHDAWSLFLDHWLVSVEVALILTVANVFLFFLAFFGLLFFFFPAILIWIVALATANTVLFISGFVVGSILFVMYIMLIGSVFTIFSTSCWAYLFMKMHKHGIKSRIHHWLSA